MGRSSDVILLTVLAIILLGVPTGFAIHCFVCNSHKNYEGEECWNLTPDQNKSTLYSDCNNVEPRKHYERCRVMVQTVGSDTRIIRSCATWPEKSEPSHCIDRTGSNKIKLRYCECAEDGCNAAPSLYASFLALSAAAGAALVVVL